MILVVLLNVATMFGILNTKTADQIKSPLAEAAVAVVTVVVNVSAAYRYVTGRQSMKVEQMRQNFVTDNQHVGIVQMHGPPPDWSKVFGEKPVNKQPSHPNEGAKPQYGGEKSSFIPGEDLGDK